MTSPDPTLHLHVGLPKTATTFLQSGFFRTLDGLLFRSTPQSDRFAETGEESGHGVLAFCLRRSAAIWRDEGDSLFADLLGGPDDWRARPRDVLISDEAIGRAGSRPVLLAAHLAAIREQAERWGFARVTAICAFRRQDRWYASHYAQMSDRNPRAAQGDFERAVDALLDPARERYRLGMLLDYRRLREALTDGLGAANVMMAPYEDLQAAEARFLSRLASFLDAGAAASTGGGGFGACDRNVRSSGDDEWRLRPSQSLARRLRERAARLLGDRAGERLSGRGRAITLTPELSERILAGYAESNRRLASELDVDLAAFGYFPNGSAR